MNIINTPLAGCVLLEPKRFSDKRGFFQEMFRAADYSAAGINTPLVQDNWSRSVKGVLRGMHFQRNHAQGKLISVLRGEIFDVAVDIRPGSATFGQWHGEYLSEHQPRQLWLPPGFAHGFLVLSDVADVLYKTSQYYQASDEGSFIWNDADLAIAWPVMPKLLSDKDAAAPGFKQALR
ncbi:dTDP-4-dehydrorhamnose 3,5-epimerase [Rheinheimera nanhaiensis]|uniref:dTDP-4-dehydrorhamnose 3,5-epimerase n=1 Tax=Rheinheimera nanhaiensis E407-8 TaxID=562729 RepID=I1DWC8_9GAMM|nr:dTDP-4-dehydrorhamnose 3,5-epimerase [Rheinheimera nanhaiensis]GAB58356.1 dTDP-4-dehydrorhamnose 3,5-epimerase [Rheinheimera nanhaiensis E407-8]